MRKFMGRALVVLFLVVLVNDGGRYLAALYRIDDVTRNMAFAASEMAKVRPGTNTGWPAAAKLAQAAGVEVTGYLQIDSTVTVTGRIPVSGTWAAGPIVAWLAHQPPSTPLTVTHEASSTS